MSLILYSDFIFRVKIYFACGFISFIQKAFNNVFSEDNDNKYLQEQKHIVMGIKRQFAKYGISSIPQSFDSRPVIMSI